MTKERFQAALQNTPALLPLFSGELDAKITALKTLAQSAEDSFWSLARAEFAVTGSQITARPYTATTTMCANALTLINQILVSLHSICDDSSTHSDISWSNSTKTLYAPFVAKVCDALLEKTAAIKVSLSDVHDSVTYTSRMTGLEAVYEWALGALSEFGPNFPEVLTSYYSTSASAYSNPLIGLAGIAAGKVTLTNYIAENETDDWATKGSAVAVGNKILIETLDIDGDLAASLVGAEGLVVSAVTDDDSGVMTLQRPDFSLTDVLPEVLSDPATSFGEVFVIRILDREVPN